MTSRTNLALQSKVKQLEAQLAATRTSPPSLGNPPSEDIGRRSTIGSIFSAPEVEADLPHPDEGAYSNSVYSETAPAPSDTDSPVDVLAAGIFDDPLSGFICYFGRHCCF